MQASQVPIGALGEQKGGGFKRGRDGEITRQQTGQGSTVPRNTRRRVIMDSSDEDDGDAEETQQTVVTTTTSSRRVIMDSSDEESSDDGSAGSMVQLDWLRVDNGITRGGITVQVVGVQNSLCYPTKQEIERQDHVCVRQGTVTAILDVSADNASDTLIVDLNDTKRFRDWTFSLVKVELDETDPRQVRMGFGITRDPPKSITIATGSESDDDAPQPMQLDSGRRKPRLVRGRKQLEEQQKQQRYEEMMAKKRAVEERRKRTAKQTLQENVIDRMGGERGAGDDGDDDDGDDVVDDVMEDGSEEFEEDEDEDEDDEEEHTIVKIDYYDERYVSLNVDLKGRKEPDFLLEKFIRTRSSRTYDPPEITRVTRYNYPKPNFRRVGLYYRWYWNGITELRQDYIQIGRKLKNIAIALDRMNWKNINGRDRSTIFGSYINFLYWDQHKAENVIRSNIDIPTRLLYGTGYVFESVMGISVVDNDEGDDEEEDEAYDFPGRIINLIDATGPQNPTEEEQRYMRKLSDDEKELLRVKFVNFANRVREFHKNLEQQRALLPGFHDPIEGVPHTFNVVRDTLRNFMLSSFHKSEMGSPTYDEPFSVPHQLVQRYDAFTEFLREYEDMQEEERRSKAIEMIRDMQDLSFLPSSVLKILNAYKKYIERSAKKEAQRKKREPDFIRTLTNAWKMFQTQSEFFKIAVDNMQRFITTGEEEDLDSGAWERTPTSSNCPQSVGASRFWQYSIAKNVFGLIQKFRLTLGNIADEFTNYDFGDTLLNHTRQYERLLGEGAIITRLICGVDQNAGKNLLGVDLLGDRERIKGKVEKKLKRKIGRDLSEREKTQIAALVDTANDLANAIDKAKYYLGVWEQPISSDIAQDELNTLWQVSRQFCEKIFSSGHVGNREYLREIGVEFIEIIFAFIDSHVSNSLSGSYVKLHADPESILIDLPLNVPPRLKQLLDDLEVFINESDDELRHKGKKYWKPTDSFNLLVPLEKKITTDTTVYPNRVWRQSLIRKIQNTLGAVQYALDNAIVSPEQEQYAQKRALVSFILIHRERSPEVKAFEERNNAFLFEKGTVDTSDFGFQNNTLKALMTVLRAVDEQVVKNTMSGALKTLFNDIKQKVIEVIEKLTRSIEETTKNIVDTQTAIKERMNENTKLFEKEELTTRDQKTIKRNRKHNDRDRNTIAFLTLMVQKYKLTLKRYKDMKDRLLRDEKLGFGRQVDLNIPVSRFLGMTFPETYSETYALYSGLPEVSMLHLAIALNVYNSLVRQGKVLEGDEDDGD